MRTGSEATLPSATPGSPGGDDVRLRSTLEQAEQLAFAEEAGLRPHLLDHAHRVDRGPCQRLAQWATLDQPATSVDEKASPAPVRSVGAAGSGYEGTRKRCIPSNA